MEPCPFFLRGEIDIANADGLAAMLRSDAGQQAGDVLVDCMDLLFIDCRGIGSLVLSHRELAQRGRNLWLIHPSPFFARILGLLDLTHLVRPDRELLDSN